MELVKRIRLSIDFANHLLEVNKSLQDKNLIDAAQVITNLVDELIYQGKLNCEHYVLFERMENYLENDNDLPMLGLEALKVALKDKITRSYGGKKRAMNNEAHVKLNQIVLEYLERYQASGLLKQRGRLE